MKKIRFAFKKRQWFRKPNKKFLWFISLGILLVTLPLLVYLVQIPQETRERADVPNIETIVNTFVTRSGTKLILSGNQFRFAGPNIYWLGLDENVGGIHYPTKFRIKDAIDTAREMGAKVIRSHAAISVGCSLCIEPSLNTFNDAGFQALDYAVYVAKQDGIRLILPLIDNYHYYHGGKHNFTDWRGVTEDSFYTNKQVITDFEAYVNHILNHVNTITGVAYKNEPAIMAWETGNELQISTGSFPSAWTQTIGNYIHGIASQQLIGDGHQGVDQNALKYSVIDMYTSHFYPMLDSKLQNDASTVSNANKVYFAGEFDWLGVSGSGDTLQSFLSSVDKNTSVSGDLFWSLFGHNDVNGFVQHNDGFTFHYTGDSTDMKGRGQQLRSHAYILQGIKLPPSLIPNAPHLWKPVKVTGGININWQGVVAANTYVLQRSLDNSNWTTIKTGLTDNNSPWTDLNANKNNTNWYKIAAINLDSVQGSFSASLHP